MLIKDLQQNIAQLKGLGSKACKNLQCLHIQHIADLLQHYPARYLDHLKPHRLRQVYQDIQKPDSYFYIRAKIIEHNYIPWRNSRDGQALKVTIADEGLHASLLCFGRNFLAAHLPIHSTILVAGKFQLRYGELQSSSFSFEVLPNKTQAQTQAETQANTQAGIDADINAGIDSRTTTTSRKPLAKESGAYNGSEFDCLLPVYPLTEGISQKQIRNAMAQALQHFSFAIEDEVPISLQNKYQMLSKKQALRQIHFPATTAELVQAHRSLIYEELLVLMLMIQRRRLQQHRELQRNTSQTFCLQSRGQLLETAQSNLPFVLSQGQNKALEQILHSFTLDVPMNCLLQGDVGCGKTMVALLSALPWLEAGAQVALMAPTEILARQLLQNFESLRHSLEQAEGTPLLQTSAQITKTIGQTAFLSGSTTGNKRKELLRQLRNGEVQILVGTHALFSQAVEFSNLRYIIVDEQHRFGVEQRLNLKRKAPHPPHVLLMSATPIPRTLALTLYGDLEIAVIDGMPAERKTIKTHLVRQGNDEKMYHFIHGQLAAGHQVYFIYPLIAETESETMRSIEQMQQKLQQIFLQHRLGVVHGKMPAEQKDTIMDSFRKNQIQILLATTVVEVGVDVPNASVMVVEHAEHFGLAQLHQLRGRVGRGSIQGYCFLVYRDTELSALAKQRLLTLKESCNGFVIAEKDLELRGPGDLLGAEQSGSMELQIAKIPEDIEWLEHARLDAIEILETDYALLQAEHQGLRKVLRGKSGLEA